MKLKSLIFGLIAWEGGWRIWQEIERNKVFKTAKQRAKKLNKPLLVVGEPYGQYECGDVMIDLKKDSKCENHVKASVEDIPFDDKYFGVAFVSHVIEHTCDPEKALKELYRVADEVFILHPKWWELRAYLVPGHTWLMYKRNGEYKFKRLRNKCNVPNYLGTGKGLGNYDIMVV